MARLSVDITVESSTKAVLTGTFTGGDSSYSLHRALYVTGIYSRGFYLESTDKGGSSSDFEDTFEDLSPGETYDWEAVLCYWDTDLDSWVETSYSDSGSFTMEGSSSAKAVINVGTYRNPNWNSYSAIVNTGTYYNPNWTSIRPINNYGTYRNPDWR